MIKDGKGYYDIDCDFEELFVQNGMIDMMFYLKDLKQRKLFLNDAVDQNTVWEIIRNIMQYNKEDKGLEAENRTPIILYVTSVGGDVDSGFGLIDVIQSSVTPVYTVNIGFQYSMGFLIGLAGHKRFCTKNAKFLMHDGSNIVYGSGTKVQDEIDFRKKVESRIRNYVLSRSNISQEEYDKNLRVEWYLFADEAKEKGFTDYIVGVDCPIDEII